MMPLDFRKIVTFVVKAPKPRTFDLLLRAALKRKMSTERHGKAGALRAKSACAA